MNLMAEHGTNTRYTNEGCRCDACRAAHTERARFDRATPLVKLTKRREVLLARITRDEAELRTVEQQLFALAIEEGKRNADAEYAKLINEGTADIRNMRP